MIILIYYIYQRNYIFFNDNVKYKKITNLYDGFLESLKCLTPETQQNSDVLKMNNNKKQHARENDNLLTFNDVESLKEQLCKNFEDNQIKNNIKANKDIDTIPLLYNSFGQQYEKLRENITTIVWERIKGVAKAKFAGCCGL